MTPHGRSFCVLRSQTRGGTFTPWSAARRTRSATPLPRQCR